MPSLTLNGPPQNFVWGRCMESRMRNVTYRGQMKNDTPKPFAVHLAAIALFTTLTALASPLPTNAHAEGHSDTVISKKITKAACLKKPGYIWIEQSRRCVKDTRGSH